MIQDLKSHFNYYFKEKNVILKSRFYSRVIYTELDEIIKGVLLSVNVFKSGVGCLLYENLKQDIHLKVYENITFVSLKTIKNLNGYIFTFAKNHCLNELKRNDKLEEIKEIVKNSCYIESI